MRKIEFCSYCEKIKNKRILFETETAVAVYNDRHAGNSILVISKYHEDYMETNNRLHSDFSLIIKNSISFLQAHGDLRSDNFSIVYSHIHDSHMHCVIIPTRVNKLLPEDDFYE